MDPLFSIRIFIKNDSKNADNKFEFRFDFKPAELTATSRQKIKGLVKPDPVIIVKKIFIATLILIVCLSNAQAFLAKTREIDPENYPFLLCAKDLQVYNIKLDLSGSAEKARIKKWINGVYDIKYEYDRRDSDDFNTLFFSAKLEIEKNKREAGKSFREGLAVITKTSAAAGMPCREIKNTIKWGDENYYAVRERNGKPVGLIFIGRLRNKIYTLIMAGLYSSDHSLITDLVIPKLQHIENFQIKE